MNINSLNNINFMRPTPSNKPQLIYNSHDHYDLDSFLIDKKTIDSNNQIIINNQINSLKNNNNFINNNHNNFINNNHNNFINNNHNNLNKNNNSNLNNYYNDDEYTNNNFPFNVRNPIDAKFDCEKKERLTDINLFKQVQGGNIINFIDNKPIPTRVKSYITNNNMPMHLPTNCAFPINKY